MHDNLRIGLGRKRVFLAYEMQIFKRAMEFYDQHFERQDISSAQMAAVTSYLSRSSTWETGRNLVADFLERQETKLKKKAERTGKKSSWLCPPKSDGADESIGGLLRQWIKEELYLGPIAEREAMDRLAALQRFWNSVYGRYRYEKAFNNEMILEEGK